MERKREREMIKKEKEREIKREGVGEGRKLET